MQTGIHQSDLTDPKANAWSIICSRCAESKPSSSKCVHSMATSRRPIAPDSRSISARDLRIVSSYDRHPIYFSLLLLFAGGPWANIEKVTTISQPADGVDHPPVFASDGHCFKMQVQIWHFSGSIFDTRIARSSIIC